MAKQPVGLGTVSGLMARGAVTAPTKPASSAGKGTTLTPSRARAAKASVQSAQPVIAKTKMASLVQPAVASKITPAVMAIDPNILFNLLDKTTTQLAQGALQQLKDVSPTVLVEAINTVQNRNIRPEGLLNYLERRVKIGEVLNEMAKNWDREIQDDFVQALNMEPNKLEVMDSIVSLAILNDPDLTDDLRIEHMDETDDAALLENRRIIWQYPPPGTPLDPPYVVLVAVEHQDLNEAQEVIDDILGQLKTQEGFKVPRSAQPARRLPVGRAAIRKTPR